MSYDITFHQKAADQSWEDILQLDAATPDERPDPWVWARLLAHARGKHSPGNRRAPGWARSVTAGLGV
jgi:hypothetical protein